MIPILLRFWRNAGQAVFSLVAAPSDCFVQAINSTGLLFLILLGVQNAEPSSLDFQRPEFSFLLAIIHYILVLIDT